jgi:hypothetical protein
MLVCLICLVFSARAPRQVNELEETQERAASDLRARIESSPKLPFTRVHFAAKPPAVGWESGAVSGIALDREGRIYEIQRSDKADPVLVLDSEGKVLRSWGRGEFNIPHSIRIDPSGNVWTVDAGSSVIIKYSPLGEKLMTITVGERPDNGSPFDGTTDIAFGPNGRLYITDGYGNARILEYTPDGKRVKQWGKPGTGPGEFSLPHAIQIDEKGTVYVADRENGRIEKFDLDGNFLGEIPHLGRVYSLKLVGGVLWSGMQSFDRPPGSAGWVVKFDCETGRILGHLDVPELRGLHSVEQVASGEPLTTLGNELLWFKAK